MKLFIIKEKNMARRKATPEEAEEAATTSAESTRKVLQSDSIYNQFDADGDGIVTDEELASAEKMMELQNRKLQIENNDKREDAQRNMAWFALAGMLLYPFSVVLALFIGVEQAGDILGDMASVYFVSVAAIVAAFYGSQAYTSGRE
jgi:hypothetical protein